MAVINFAQLPREEMEKFIKKFNKDVKTLKEYKSDMKWYQQYPRKYKEEIDWYIEAIDKLNKRIKKNRATMEEYLKTLEKKPAKKVVAKHEKNNSTLGNLVEKAKTEPKEDPNKDIHGDSLIDVAKKVCKAMKYPSVTPIVFEKFDKYYVYVPEKEEYSESKIKKVINATFKELGINDKNVKIINRKDFMV